MNYSAISIQGNILTSEILEKIRQEDTRFQSAKDFNLNQGDSVRDEINLAWSVAISHWNAFKQKRENLLNTDTGTKETRRYWAIPLLQLLGYDIQQSNAELINDKSYAVSHRASNKDGFPIHIVGIQQSLEKAVVGGVRLSPHALIQEYLNNTEHVYGFTTNGALLRVLRDATRLSRLSYIEFNLEQMMEEGLYVEFALLYRTLHSSRIANKKEESAECILEWYHQEALSSGSRIRERLSQAVEQSMLLLANGILENTNNEALRQSIEEGKLDAEKYYLYILRTVYRILFLLVIEERKLIYPDKRETALNRKRDIYYKYYSIQRLTYLVEKKVYVDPRKTDLWQSLLTTFHLFESSELSAKLEISALGSGLFANNVLGSLQDQLINNETLLKVLRYLVTFENENKQLVRVNYADLDVEEFGSVYEGLLEYDPAITNHQFHFLKGDARSSSGSHYTPEELVKPLITHSLDYLIADKLKEADPEAGLLSLTICDVACGSGHILLSAARRVGFELAKYRSKEDQPTPSALRIAIRDVIKNCIYGVDLNPLAVELCKVALWLEAHEPGQPMNFLDHHIKCGNAIVGLAHFEELENGIASEAFKTLPGDDKEIATAFRNRNNLELKTKGQLSTYEVAKVDDDLKGVQKEFTAFSQLPENTPEQIAKKEQAYHDLTKGKKWWRLKQLADLQVAQFFIPKTVANKEKLTTHSQYMNYLKTGAQILDRGAAIEISNHKRFFHWFLEFPQVFQKGGFDCILGNPPFLGGLRISKSYGNNLLNYIQNTFKNCKGTCDFVAYFFRRNYQIINKSSGFLSLISTNTISQGDTREGALDIIISMGGKINYAVKSQIWPGKASVEVSLITISNREDVNFYLGNNKVNTINSLLDNQVKSIPFALCENQNKSYKGVTPLGKGFVLDKEQAKKLLIKSINLDVVKKYLIGDDVNNNYDQSPGRYIIHFGSMSINEASKYEDCFSIVKEKVQPERLLNTYSKSAKEKWWLFERSRPELYSQLSKKSKTLVSCTVTKYLSFSFLPSDWIFDVGTNVIVDDTYLKFAIYQSSIHETWARKYGSSLESRLRYTNEDCIENFPSPIILDNVIQNKTEVISEYLYNFRKQSMLNIQLGLTKTYNIFHSKGIQVLSIDVKDKQVVALQKHLEKTPNTINFDEAVLGIIKLRSLHKEMDEAVLEAYGWQDIALRHDFYEVEYLPENDRVRYTIHPEARKEVLKRLLELNHKIHEEEVAAGLWGKKKTAKEKIEKKNTKTTANKKGRNTNEVNEGYEPYNQQSLFEAPNLFSQPNGIKEGSKVSIHKEDGVNFKYHIFKNAIKGNFTGEYKQIATTSSLAEIMLGRNVGDTFVFGGVNYKILEVG